MRAVVRVTGVGVVRMRAARVAAAVRMRGWRGWRRRFVCGRRGWRRWFVCGRRGWRRCLEVAGRGRRYGWGRWFRGDLGLGNRFCGDCGRVQMQQPLGHGPGVELRATGEPPPERDYLLRRRLPTPRREQELLGEGPQVNRVWLAPGKGVARQRERGACREQRVGPHAGDSGARSVERPELLPTSGRLQELRRDAAESVLGPGEVVGAHRHDHGWLIRGRAGGTADDLGVGDHVVAHRVLRQHPGQAAPACGHGARPPHRVLGLFVAGRHVIGRHDDPREVVAELLVENRGNLAVPGLAGLAVDVVALGDCLVGDCLVRLVCLVARAHVSLEEFRHQQPDAGDPGEE